jgi:hypothetical protein
LASANPAFAAGLGSANPALAAGLASANPALAAGLASNFGDNFPSINQWFSGLGPLTSTPLFG